jgi:hypothetical protein
MNQDNCITITNLATGEERTYNISLPEALISAVEYDKGNRNTWEYPKPENVEFFKGQFTLGLGDWCGFLTKAS